MELYGPTIQMIRTEKKISRRSLYRKVLKKENALAFEYGNLTIGLDKFIELLDRLNMNYEEFLYLHNGSQTRHHRSLPDSLYHAYLQKNFVQLEKNYRLLISSHNEETKFYAHVANLLYEALMTEPIPQSSASSDSYFLKKYLLERKKWFWQEIDLLLIIYPLVEVEISQRIMSTCFRSLSQYRQFTDFNLKANRLLCSYVLSCYKNGLIEEGDKWLSTLRDFSIDEEQVTEKFWRDFCLVVQSLTQNRIEKADEEFKKISVLTEILKMNTLNKEFNQQYQLFSSQYKKR